jgi:hypothetical protein
MHDEGYVLQEVVANSLPCDLELPSYNDAISLRARLNKYLRGLKEAYSGRENPYESLEILLIKPRTLRFERRSQLKLHAVDDPVPRP